MLDAEKEARQTAKAAATEAAKALRQGAAIGRVALKAAAAPPVDSGVLSCAIDGALESSVAADMAALVGE